MIKALEKGDIDLVNEATAPMAKEAKKSKEKIKVLSTPSLDYAVIGFVSHDYDKAKNKTGEVRPKYESKELRQALLYAIDRKNGLMHSSMVMELKSIHTFLQQNGLQLIQKI